jgi:hypothetical protein
VTPVRRVCAAGRQFVLGLSRGRAAAIVLTAWQTPRVVKARARAARLACLSEPVHIAHQKVSLCGTCGTSPCAPSFRCGTECKTKTPRPPNRSLSLWAQRPCRSLDRGFQGAYCRPTALHACLRQAPFATVKMLLANGACGGDPRGCPRRTTVGYARSTQRLVCPFPREEDSCEQLITPRPARSGRCARSFQLIVPTLSALGLPDCPATLNDDMQTANRDAAMGAIHLI